MHEIYGRLKDLNFTIYQAYYYLYFTCIQYLCIVQIFTLVTREITLFLQVLCSKRFLYVRCKLRLNTYSISGQLISHYIFILKKISKEVLKFRFFEKAKQNLELHMFLLVLLLLSNVKSKWKITPKIGLPTTLELYLARLSFRNC